MALSFDFYARIKIIETHKDPILLEKARSLIPKEMLELSTQRLFRQKQIEMNPPGQNLDETVQFENTFLSELLKWFKSDFFLWFNKPECTECDIPCEFSKGVKDYQNPSVDLVEIFLCPKCQSESYFNRYNDTNILLETRTGRCHEHAQTFALICKALNYDCRVVLDILTDHIWNEVYSDIQKRWIHCDPSEAMFNKPLLYEVGWNKTLSYIIAIGDTGIQEVTWRYTTEKSRKKIKRDPHFDSLITQVTNDYQKQILENVTPAKKKYLLTRLVCELTELLAVMPSIEGSYEGRQSGSRDWRLQRGEVGKQVTYVRHIFKVDPVIQDTKRFAMWYSANSDAYIVSNYTGKDIVKYGWKNFVDSYKNIVRKEESDWKKSYLAREVNEETGVLKWRFMTDSKISFTGVYVLTNCFVCENGKVKCSIYSPGSNSSFQFENEVSKFWEGSVPPTKELYVEIQLSGGTGINAWQHAQFGRQSLHEGSTVSFGIIVYIQKD